MVGTVGLPNDQCVWCQSEDPAPVPLGWLDVSAIPPDTLHHVPAPLLRDWLHYVAELLPLAELTSTDKGYNTPPGTVHPIWSSLPSGDHLTSAETRNYPNLRAWLQSSLAYGGGATTPAASRTVPATPVTPAATWLISDTTYPAADSLLLPFLTTSDRLRLSECCQALRDAEIPPLEG